MISAVYSEATAREVDLAVHEMIDNAYVVAQDLLRSRMADLKAGTRLLLERERITPDDFPPLQRRAAASVSAVSAAGLHGCGRDEAGGCCRGA